MLARPLAAVAPPLCRSLRSGVTARLARSAGPAMFPDRPLLAQQRHEELAQRFLTDNPVAKLLGMSASFEEDNRSWVAMRAVPALLDCNGRLPTGVVATLMEASARLAIAASRFPTQQVLASDLSIHRVRCVGRGHALRATTDVVGQRPDGYVVDTRAFDEAGELVAQATGTFRVAETRDGARPARRAELPGTPPRLPPGADEESRHAAEQAAVTVKSALRAPIVVTDMSGWAAEDASV